MAQDHPEVSPACDTQIDCCVCGQRIFGAHYGMGDGRGRRFGHPECYWRKEAEFWKNAAIDDDLDAVAAAIWNEGGLDWTDDKTAGPYREDWRRRVLVGLNVYRERLADRHASARPFP